MKRKLLLLFAFSLFFVMGKAGGVQIDLQADIPQPPPGPLPQSLTYYSVSAFISETDLSVYFEQPVGKATITIYDSKNMIADQMMVDTNSNGEVIIPIDILDAGDYTIKISYGTTNLVGYFLLT